VKLKLPQDMSLGHRIALTVVIVLIILFAISFIGWYLGRWDDGDYAHGAAARYEVPERFQRELIDLDRQALNAAYINHADKLWSNYVSQASNLGHDTVRVDVGLDHLHQAWVIARERIEAREKALNKCVGC